MTIEAVKTAARQAEAKRLQARAAITAADKRLQDTVIAYIAEQPGSLRQMARELGVSAPYLSDIRHGRRGISVAFLDKLVEWGK